MPRIFDCFTFFNELDVLEMRLEELYPFVDCFVITEADHTFRGQPKPFYFDKDDSRWAPFIDKIKTNRCFQPDQSIFRSTWDREITQRNGMAGALKTFKAEPNDLVIISDVDEIPRGGIINWIKTEPPREYRLLMDKYSYALNMLTSEGNNVVRVLPYGDFNERSMEQIRRGPDGVPVPDGGWEFSSLGTPEHVYHKLLSFAHSEFDDYISPRIIQERIDAGVDILGRDIKHTVVEIDETFPVAVQNNPEYWSKFLWQPLDY